MTNAERLDKFVASFLMMAEHHPQPPLHKHHPRADDEATKAKERAIARAILTEHSTREARARAWHKRTGKPEGALYRYWLA